MMPDTWHGCYDGSWRELIVEGAWKHPARFAPTLIERIYDHAFAQGWVARGSTILDPFGGVGCGGIVAAYKGLFWQGCELEPHFVEIANRNFELHRSRWQVGVDPMPVILQGDSRKLRDVLGAADCVVSSPPYAEALSAANHGIRDERRARNASDIQGAHYGSSPGQLAGMKAGDVAAVVSSPPYEATISNQSADVKNERRFSARFSKADLSGRNYGTALGQLGNARGPTFWEAARDIVTECYAVLAPGGHAIFVTKDYVRNKARVPFTDDWCKLCEACGFRLVCRHEATQVKERRSDGLFGEHVERTERKGFFRRLAEKKGSPRIDHEDVTCWKKVDEK